MVNSKPFPLLRSDVLTLTSLWSPYRRPDDLDTKRQHRRRSSRKHCSYHDHQRLNFGVKNGKCCWIKVMFTLRGDIPYGRGAEKSHQVWFAWLQPEAEDQRGKPSVRRWIWKTSWRYGLLSASSASLLTVARSWWEPVGFWLIGFWRRRWRRYTERNNTERITEETSCHFINK